MANGFEMTRDPAKCRRVEWWESLNFNFGDDYQGREPPDDDPRVVWYLGEDEMSLDLLNVKQPENNWVWGINIYKRPGVLTKLDSQIVLRYKLADEEKPTLVIPRPEQFFHRGK